MNRPSRDVLWAKRPPWLALAAMRLNASSGGANSRQAQPQILRLFLYFSAWNVSKWLLSCQFTVFSPKKRLHISSVQDTIIEVRASFFGKLKNHVSHVVSL